MSSTSPSKDPEVEADQGSGDEQDQDANDLTGLSQGDVEVKEQDRWLPIANGELISHRLV